MNLSGQKPGVRLPRLVRQIFIVLLAWPLAAFFAFVGWHKTVDPLADLLLHGAWTAHVPMPIGRFIGVSELICAVALFAALVPAAWRWTRLAAFYLAANQVVSSIIHQMYDEGRSLPQNLLLAVTLLLVAYLAKSQSGDRLGK